MPNLNYRKGASFEGRFIAKLLRDKIAIRAGRFPASKGVTDVWWVDERGRHNEAQLKFSSITKPYISPQELQKLKVFAMDMNGKILVWLVKKQARKPLDMRLIV